MRSDVTLHRLLGERSRGAWKLKTPLGEIMLLNWISHPDGSGDRGGGWRGAVLWDGKDISDTPNDRAEVRRVLGWFETQGLCELRSSSEVEHYGYTHPFKTRRELIQVICAALDRSEAGAEATVSE